MSFWKIGGRSKTFFLVLALGLAFLAQYLFTGEFITRNLNSSPWPWQPRYTFAAGLLLAALGCAIYALRKPNEERQPTVAASEPASLTELDFNALVFVSVCYVGALMTYWALGENWLVQSFWVLSMAGLIGTLWWQSRLIKDERNLAGWEWVCALSVTGLAFFLRYWQITAIPNQIDQDIPLMGTFAGQLLESNNFNWIGYSGSQHLLSYDQSLAWSMRLFGYNHYGLVMKSVLLGTLTIPLVFLLGREMFDWRVGLIASVLLAGNYTHIHFSRLLFGPSTTFFGVLAFYCLFRGLRVRQKFWFALAGLAMGIGLLMYDSSRILPVLMVGLIIWRALWNRQTLRSNLWNWVAFAVGVLIGFGPMMGFALTQPDQLIGRGNSVFLWTPEVWSHSVTAYQTDSAWGVLFGQVRNTFLALHLYGDGSPHFAFPRPMVSAFTAALFVIGIGFSVGRLRDSRYFLLTSWVVATFIFGGVLTYDPPYWPHLNIALPAISIVAGLALVVLVDRFSEPNHPLKSWLLWLGVVVALVFTRLDNWNSYYSFVVNNADPAIMSARFIQKLPTDTQVYIVSERVNWNSFVFQFLNRGIVGQNVSVAEAQAISVTPTHPIVFLVFDDPQLLTSLQQQYPNGRAETHINFEERPIFTSYFVEPPSYVPPEPMIFNPLSLPGWWLMLCVGVGVLGWKGYKMWTHRSVSVTSV